MSALVLESAEDQLELFLWKWGSEVTREEITARLTEFKRFDFNNTGYLEENQTMMLLESRGETKTAVELRAMVADIDKDHDHKVNFLEWCCAVYKKSWEETNNFSDEAARDAAMAQAKAAGEEAARVRAAIEAAKAAEEEKARRRAEELEAESRLTGVAGMSAFFKRQMEGATDVTKTNEQKIKEEAAHRKALRDAKAREAKALEDASKQKTAEEVARELEEMRKQTEEENARLEAERVERERAERAARKAAMNSKWGSPPPK